MENNRRQIIGALILADESAEWKVAGLRQLDRLTLALNEHFSAANRSDLIPLCVHWMNGEASDRGASRQLPQLSVTNDLQQFSEKLSSANGEILVMATRLVIDRGGFARILEEGLREETLPVLFISPEKLTAVDDLFSELMRRSAGGDADDRLTRQGFYLRDRSKIPSAEKWLLAGTGKSQDGVIARSLNRRISRSVTRFLLRFEITPNQWSIASIAIPIIGALFLVRGDRLGFIVGAIFFQLQSALDGCDGEIARLRYLESARGITLDGLCDRLATMLLAIGLGVGLSRQAANILQSFHFWEGIFAALAIGIGETLLQSTSISQESYVQSHRAAFNPTDQLKVWAIKNSGMLALGETATAFFVQATKRDVFNLGFALLILFGSPQLPLHILAVSALIIVILALINVVRYFRSMSRKELLRDSHEQELAGAKKKNAV